MRPAHSDQHLLDPEQVPHAHRLLHAVDLREHGHHPTLSDRRVGVHHLDRRTDPVLSLVSDHVGSEYGVDLGADRRAPARSQLVSDHLQPVEQFEPKERPVQRQVYEEHESTKHASS